MHSTAARPANQMSSGCMMLFGLPFLAAGLAIGFLVYFPMVSTWWSARGWEEVPCWIEKVEINSSRGSKGSVTYQTKASYHYKYDGRQHHSEAVSLGGEGADNMGDFQQQAHAQLLPFQGSERPFRCYVNPAKPGQAVLFRDLRWGLMLLLSAFPMLFPLAGLMVSVMGGRQAGKARAEKQQLAQHPGEPWRWKREWAEETIQASPSGVLVLLLVAAWMLAVQLPLALAIVASGELGRNPLAVLGLLPSLLGAVPLLLAWRRLQTRRVLGSPRLWLKQRPVIPGRVMEGELRFDQPLPQLSTVELHLLCEEHTTMRSGKSTTTKKELIWEKRETFGAGDARREISGVALPFRFEIPAGLPCAVVETAEFTLGAGRQHVWTLEIKSSRGGRAVSLPLPVFVTTAEAARAEQQREVEHEEMGTQPAAHVPSRPELQERLQACGVLTEFDARGFPTVIDCLPGRSRSLALFMLAFGTIWTGVFVILLLAGAPFIFKVIWGVSSPAILVVGFWHLLHHRRVELTAEEMRVRNTAGPLYSGSKSYAPRHFTGFSHDSNMQSGSQKYYRVLGDTIFGKEKLVVADGLKEAVTAQVLATRLNKWRLGLPGD